MDDQNKNLILATALSFAVILVWFLLFPPPEPPVEPQTRTESVQGQTADGASTVPGAAGDETVGTPGAGAGASAVADAPRLPIDTPNLEGSISLVGGRIDDLSLRAYRETLDPESDIVRLLSPAGTAQPYYALYGWAPGTGLTAEDVPGTDTAWTVESGETLTADSPVTLRWDSPSGLIFRRTISVDEHYLFSVEQSVENPGDTEVRAAPYAIIAREGLPDLTRFFILHEGIVSMADGQLEEKDYKSMPDFEVSDTLRVPAHVRSDVTSGWIGFTDKYWMTTLVPDSGGVHDQQMLYFPTREIYQTRTVYPAVTLAPGQTVTQTSRLFAGAKEWELIRRYQNDEGIDRFIDSIDWGWFFFLTKPIFAVLHWLHGFIGNMGWSIIALTLCLKALLFPLAYKSYASMAKMKELQPEMEKLKERAGDDRQKLQKEMMELYKKEKVNPAAGCLPILLQIPIFFSLYKVIFVTIELRHSAWFGPFRDLSAPDPTSLFNLFGVLPWAAPEPGSIAALIFIGILPLLLGISMFLQQKLNPAPTDPTQQMIFAWMPWVFMFMLGGFASGLVIYWITNNTVTFIQQYLIMRSHGYTPDVFGNIQSTFKRKKTDTK